MLSYVAQVVCAPALSDFKYSEGCICIELNSAIEELKLHINYLETGRHCLRYI